jgi:hypothetical protein
MPRLAKKMGVAPFTQVPNSVLIPIEYGALSYYVSRSGMPAMNKVLTIVLVGWGYETYLLR